MAFQKYVAILFFCYASCNKPNIIIIIGDDVGWNDVGFHGSSQIPTPNIDALGYNGIILNRFYTQELCTPSRAALLTGNYPLRFGMQGYPIIGGENRHIPWNMPTMPEQLKKLGYKTHLVGKWHLGHGYKNSTPTRRGFDSHFGYWNGYVGYFDYVMQQNDLVGFDLHNDFETVRSDRNKYATDLFTDKAVEIIKNHDGKSPLFLMVAHLAAHAGKGGTALEVPNVDETNEKFFYIRSPRRRLYAEIVNRLDKSVGDVMKTLSDRNMLENSIVLFFSDNGGQSSGPYENSASNWPLRGEKITLLEGGIRAVGAVYSTLLKQKGTINDKLMHVSDWLPTFYAAAGGNVEELGNIDGVNQWTVLNEDGDANRKEILVEYSEVLKTSAIIGFEGRFKLINGTYNNGTFDGYSGDSGKASPPYNLSRVLNSATNEAIKKLYSSKPLTEREILSLRSKIDLKHCRAENVELRPCEDLCLFDLFEDPCESRNLAENRSDIVRTLSGRLKEFYDVLVPGGNGEFDPNSDPKFFNDTWWTWLENSK